MRHASLFSGIGGFDLAADWMGWENVFHCDINPFGKKVLEYYYPNSISYGDITKTDFTIHRGEIDILTGGFPCQPYSLAGKRKGKEDERHLWPQMLRAIREIQPRWIIGENVYGLVNWDGGLVFHEVQSDLEAEGYEVFPYVLPACSINAPHRRDRVFFVAYSREFRLEFCETSRTMGKGQNQICGKGNKSTLQSETKSEIRTSTDSESRRRGRIRIEEEPARTSESNDIPRSECRISNEDRIIADSENIRVQRSRTNRLKESSAYDEQRLSMCRNTRTKWEDFPTVSPICNGDDGISDRLDSITFPKWRRETIKAGGNAVVPQLIYVLFKTISKFEELKTKQC